MFAPAPAFFYCMGAFTVMHMSTYTNLGSSKLSVLSEILICSPAMSRDWKEFGWQIFDLANGKLFIFILVGMQYRKTVAA